MEEETNKRAKNPPKMISMPKMNREERIEMYK